MFEDNVGNFGQVAHVSQSGWFSSSLHRLLFPVLMQAIVTTMDRNLSIVVILVLIIIRFSWAARIFTLVTA